MLRLFIFTNFKNHRFPMIKYRLLPETLLNEGTCFESNFFTPKNINEKHILLTHDSRYFNKLINFDLDKKEQRAIGFPMSRELIEREKRIVQGTIESSLNSIKYKVSMNIAGGTHHAFSNRKHTVYYDQLLALSYWK